ncbi:MAG: hypothetical protein BJ554DRAFT_2571 [Olpidium bornovanus]|uniref:Uncharacterized protein n=1 Tax=Olpidium bornovanus TaxID=278681 RepID=A0A8H7ZQ27_9FUNG|nr:MAG: hypothetical protein BJ554DRAFT_2571 [Olpidium bornovanus]
MTVSKEFGYSRRSRDRKGKQTNKKLLVLRCYAVQGAGQDGRARFHVRGGRLAGAVRAGRAAAAARFLDEDDVLHEPGQALGDLPVRVHVDQRLDVPDDVRLPLLRFTEEHPAAVQRRRRRVVQPALLQPPLHVLGLLLRADDRDQVQLVGRRQGAEKGERALQEGEVGRPRVRRRVPQDHLRKAAASPRGNQVLSAESPLPRAVVPLPPRSAAPPTHVFKGHRQRTPSGFSDRKEPRDGVLKSPRPKRTRGGNGGKPIHAQATEAAEGVPLPQVAREQGAADLREEAEGQGGRRG